MINFATLVLQAKSDQLKTAKADLETLADTGERTDSRLTRSSARTGAAFGSAAKAALGFAGALISIQTAAAAITSARGFDAALAETSTLIKGNAEEMEFLNKAAKDLAGEFGGNATAQVKGFYQALSSGAANVQEANALLTTANRLAVGGVTDVTTAVDALSTATNVYKAEGLLAADASDALFVGMKAGKTTVGELASSIGKVLPLSQALGISFDETVAATSALTKAGFSTAEAVTGLRASMTSILAPSADAVKIADALGIQFNAAGIEALGFGGLMDQIVEKTGGSAEAMQKLFGSTEATAAALSFAGQAGKFNAEIMELMTEKAGATEAAFNKMDEALSQRLNVQLAAMGNALLAVGEILLNVIVTSIEFATENFDAIGVVLIAIASTTIPALIGALYTMVAGLTATGVAAGIATGMMTAFRVALMLAGGPLGIVLGLLGGAAAYWLIFNNGAAQAEQQLYKTAFAEKALRSELNAFAASSVPAANSASIARVNALRQQAQAAYSAASAELALSRATANKYVGTRAQAVTGLSETVDAGRVQDLETNLDRINFSLKDMKRAAEAASVATAKLNAEASQIGTSGAAGAVDIDIPGILGAGAGGAGAGGGVADKFAARLTSLQDGMATERAELDKWYEESQAVLADRRSLELLGEEEHKALMLEVERKYRNEVADIDAQVRNARMKDMGSFFGGLAAVAEAGGGKLVAVARKLGAAEALINSYVAFTSVLRDPSFIGRPWARVGAAMAALAPGLKAVQAIKSGGGSINGGGGRGGSSGSNRNEPVSADSKPDQIVRVTVDGSGPFADMLRKSTQDIFDAVFKQNQKNGVIFQLAKS